MSPPNPAPSLSAACTQPARSRAWAPARVVVNDIGGSMAGEGVDDAPAAAVVQAIRERGGQAVTDSHSVATPEGGRDVVRTALDAYGRIDIVVNNAGILRDQPFHEITLDQLDPVIDVHLKGAFQVTVPAWSVMREQGYGRVVNTTSAAGLLGAARKSGYGAAKAGLLGLPRVLAVEGAAHGEDPGQRRRPGRRHPHARGIPGGRADRRRGRPPRRSGGPGDDEHPHPQPRPGPGLARGRLPGPRGLPRVRRGLHSGCQPGRAVLRRPDAGLPQPGTDGRGRTRPPRPDPGRDRLLHPPRTPEWRWPTSCGAPHTTREQAPCTPCSADHCSATPSPQE